MSSNYTIALAFAVQAVMAELNYEVSFITLGIAELSKAMADSIHSRKKKKPGQKLVING